MPKKGGNKGNKKGEFEEVTDDGNTKIRYIKNIRFNSYLNC